MHDSHTWKRADDAHGYFCMDCPCCTCHPFEGNHPDDECTKEGGL